jgi:hypothetical protein
VVKGHILVKRSIPYDCPLVTTTPEPVSIGLFQGIRSDETKIGHRPKEQRVRKLLQRTCWRVDTMQVEDISARPSGPEGHPRS